METFPFYTPETRPVSSDRCARFHPWTRTRTTRGAVLSRLETSSSPPPPRAPPPTGARRPGLGQHTALGSMGSPWDDLRATLAAMGEAFGAAAAAELDAEGAADVAGHLRGAVKGKPEGAGRKAAEAAWARLQTGVGWTSSAWRECYVLGQLREATELGERASGMPACASASTATAEDGNEEEARDELLRRAMLAVDMAHIMGGPGELVQQFGRPVEALVREGQRARCLRGGNGNATHGGAAVTDEEKEQPALGAGPLVTPAGTPLLIPDVLPASAALKLDPEHLLERAEGLTPREFKKGYFNTDTPVALGNIGSRWDAITKWRDLAWFREQHGHRNVPLEVGAYDDVANWREEVMPFSRFIDEHLLPGLADELEPATSGSDSAPMADGVGPPRRKGVAYLAQHQLFEQLPSLLRDFDPPPLCDVAGGLQRVNAWVGTAGTVTPCHFDSYDNLLGQVAGYKFVRLYAESDTPYLYRHVGAWAENRSWPGEKDGARGDTRGAGEGSGGSVDGVDMGRPRRDAQGNISQVDVENPDLEKFPLFAKANHMDVILGKASIRARFVGGLSVAFFHFQKRF